MYVYKYVCMYVCMKLVRIAYVCKYISIYANANVCNYQCMYSMYAILLYEGVDLTCMDASFPFLSSSDFSKLWISTFFVLYRSVTSFISYNIYNVSICHACMYVCIYYLCYACMYVCMYCMYIYYLFYVCSYLRL